MAFLSDLTRDKTFEILGSLQEGRDKPPGDARVSSAPRGDAPLTRKKPVSADAVPIQHAAKVELAKEMKATNWKLSTAPNADGCECLFKTFSFVTFKQTFLFMKLVAEIADEVGVYPEWYQRQNRLEMWVYDLRFGNPIGISRRCFDFAKEIDIKEISFASQPYVYKAEVEMSL